MFTSVRDIAIVGCGGFGREVKWLIDRINEKEQEWNVIGFFDDSLTESKLGYPPIIGTVEDLEAYPRELSVVVAVGNSLRRRSIVQRLTQNELLCFPSLVDPSAIIGESVYMGNGVVVCASAVITTNIHLAEHVHVNPNCNIGHDTCILSFCTLFSASVVSGNVTIGSCCEVGANACLLQGLSVGNRVKIGAGAVVVKDIDESDVTCVGVPAVII